MQPKDKALLIVASNLSDNGSAKICVDSLIETIEVNLAAARVHALEDIENILKSRFDFSPDENFWIYNEMKKIIKELKSEK